MPNDFRIVRAGLGDVDLVYPLFDQYRQFYTQVPDPAGARRFIGTRITNGDSVIFAAMRGFGPGARAAGFTQLYPSFSSVSMSAIWTLNDLFVTEPFRRSGIARALLEHAATFGKQSGAARLVLLTAHDNAPARALYEKLGWDLDTKFSRYTLKLT